MVPVGMFMNMSMNNVPPRFFQQQQQNAIQQAAKQSRNNRKMPIGSGSSQSASRNNPPSGFRGQNSQTGGTRPLTQGGMSQMMSQPGNEIRI